MKIVLAAVALLPFVLAAPSQSQRDERAVPRCILGVPACKDITLNCVSDWDITQPFSKQWTKKACIASVACLGSVDQFEASLKCLNGRTVIQGDAAPHLDYQTYASIVGDCAWQSGGCPITPQNFVDLAYSSATATFPRSPADILRDWWTPIVKWAVPGATDPTKTSIPYKNFDDYLRFSGKATSPPPTGDAPAPVEN